jgi:hypothetical protein
VLHLRKLPARSGAPVTLRLAAISLLLPAIFLACSAQRASAKAPAIVSVVFDAAVYASPDSNSPQIGGVTAGSEAELTGDAAPGFLAIYYDDGVGWVHSQDLSFGVRPGIDTAVTLTDTPLLAAPMPDADVVKMVPKGETVILTGAQVNGYDAASHKGAGGWINDRNIAR